MSRSRDTVRLANPADDYVKEEIKGLANVEQVLLDTADSVMDTKRKIEFGVQQIIFKVGQAARFSVSASE